MNINISLINNKISNNINLLKKEKKREKKEDSSNIYISNICVYDFFLKNEIIISEKLRDIPCFLDRFHVLENCNFINIGQINEIIFEKIDFHPLKNEKYILCQYNNRNIIELNTFLFNILTPKLFILNVLNSFSYLLTSLIKLNELDICFFNLSPENIIFVNELNNSNPLLQNFKNSLLMEYLDESYINKIIKDTHNYTYKPLEVHVLFYLIQNNEETLSFMLIQNICDNYIKNMSVLSLFSETYKEKYGKLCVESLKKYINKPKSMIIEDILDKSDTWDSYALSLIYLHIIGNISRVFFLKGTFIEKLSILLSKNIHPDSSKRENLKDILKNYEKLYYHFNDWSFVNNINISKMSVLFDFLSK